MAEVVKAERNSSFELLRILLMLSIVIGHFILQTPCLEVLHGSDLFTAVVLSSMRRTAVNVFLMLGVWFMVDSAFRPSRLIKLHSQLWFYTVSIFILLKVFHIPVGLKDTIFSIFPFFSFALWFVSGYICLIALSPFLKKVFDLDRMVLKKMLIVLTIFIPVMSTIWIKMDNVLNILVWFIYVYLCMGYYKKYLHNHIKVNPYLVLFAGVIVYFILCTIKFVLLDSNNLNYVYKYVDAYIRDYKSVPNLLVSVPIFYFFLNLNIGTNKIINFVAKSALATYIIHQAPGFYLYMWNNIFKADYIIHSPHAIMYIILVPFIVYFVCMIIDYIRRELIEPLYEKTRMCRILEQLLGRFYSNLMEHKDV